MSLKPLRVAITGVSGNIGYASLFRIASGALLGANQPIELSCLELPHAMDALKGTLMELSDCAFPLVTSVSASDDPNEAFCNVDYALLIGSKPRTKGMERADLMNDNGDIFSVQGKALNENANPNCKIVVVGNPANTNCLIAASHAPNIPEENFSALTRLDHNRAVGQVCDRLGANPSELDGITIWGNHSPSQYPDLHHATVKGAPALDAINDFEWYSNDYIPRVAKRGAEIIQWRGASSAASAGSAAIDHIHDWHNGNHGKWTSMAVMSDGSYDTPKGVIYSFPVTCGNGKWSIVQGLKINDFSRQKMDETGAELVSEKEMVSSKLGPRC